MKISCVSTPANGRESYNIVVTLGALGYEVDFYERPQNQSLVNDEEVEMLIAYIKKHNITHFISVQLIYNVAIAADITGIKCISIIWDAPYNRLYTPFGRMPNCWFAVFDKIDAKQFQEDGFPHILYQPLAPNLYTLENWKYLLRLGENCENDVCFIGSLYDENSYDKELSKMSEVMCNFFESIFEEAAFRWDGVDRIHGKTGDDIIKYLRIAVPEFSMVNLMEIKDSKLFEDIYLIRKLANIERIGVLNLLAEYFQVTCCTYDCPSVKKLIGVNVLPPARGDEAFAAMVARSKINLNISLKGIMGGTPLRVMDTMGAGGFVLSNYCEETAELFEEGNEIEMFRTPEELAEKTAYYLQHEEERSAIARAGQKKVRRDFSYSKVLKRIMDWVERG